MPLLNDAQKNAVQSRKNTVIVSASAGCGKTTVLIERILSLLSEGARLTEMVICTFTKAAAADMKDKLFKRLAALALDGSEFANLALEDLPIAQISTLHSFCQQLIKSYFYAVELDPAFEIISEGDAYAMLLAAIEAAVEQMLQTKNPIFTELYEVFLNKRKPDKLISAIKKIYTYASVLPDFDKFLSGEHFAALPHSEVLKRLKDIYKQKAQYLLPRARELLIKTKHESFLRNLPAVEALYADIAALTDSGVRVYGKIPNSAVLQDLNDEYAALKKEYSKLYSRYLEVMESADHELCLPYIKTLLDVAAQAGANYAHTKHTKSFADYQDLEHNALKILKSAAKSEIDKQYKYIFVDEYQDINPVQEQIISSLAATKFFVGDIKQSIYGFRMCDCAIFADKLQKSQASDLADAILLNKNFRSTDGILSFCNNVFSQIMTYDFGMVDYQSSAAFECENKKADVEILIACGSGEKASVEPVVYSVKNHDYSLEDLSLTEAEANLTLKTILQKSTALKASGSFDPYGEIAVLLRAANSRFCKILTAKLKSAGIPYCQPAKICIADCPEIMDIISYLRLIDNSCDDISCAAVMRSFFGGFSDDELCLIRSNSPESDTPFYKAVKNMALNDSSIGQKTAQFLNKLKKYSDLAYCLDASDLCGQIIAEHEYFKYVYALPYGDEKAKLLSQFLDMLEACPYKSSVLEFLRFIEAAMPVLEIPQELGKVKIMTVHSSKGLEFSHVILADCARKFDLRDLHGDILLDPEFGLAMKFFDKVKRKACKTGLHYYVYERLYKKLAEEEMRILYVALTRAKQSLTIIGSQKDGQKIKKDNLTAKNAKSLLDFMQAGEGINIQYFDISDTDFLPPQKKIVLKKNADPILCAKIKEYTDFKYPYQTTLPPKTAVTALSKSQSDDENTPVLFDSQGALRGTAYHEFLEAMDFKADFEAEFLRICQIYPKAESLLDKSILKSAHDLLGKLTKGKAFKREVKFIADLKTEQDSEPILVQGVVDLLIIDNNSAVIVDYKTGYAEGELLKKYSKQVSLYAAAVEKLLKLPIAKKLLYMIDSRKFIEIS